MNNYFFILSEQSKIVTLFCGWIFKARVEEEGIVLVNKCFVLYVLDDLVGCFFFFFLVAMDRVAMVSVQFACMAL